MSTVARKPAAANPTAVEPNELIARNELALLSASSDAISGRMLSQAGSKNWRTVAARKSSPYIATMPPSLPSRSKAIGIMRTKRPRRRSDASRIRLRSKRSTKTPANSPTNRVGSAATMSTRPTLSAEPVSLKTRMPAARSVSDEPMVETSCADHIRLKSRLRKMANIGPESTGQWRPESVPRGTPAEKYSLAREQPALQLETCRAPAPRAAAVATEGAVAGDDAMARDHEPDRASPDGTADGPSRPRPIDHPRDLPIARGDSGWNPTDRLEDAAVPRRPIRDVDGERLQAREVAGDERPQGRRRRLEVRRGSRPPFGARRRGLLPHCDRRDMEPPLQLPREQVRRGEVVERGDAALGRGKGDRPPRRRDRRGANDLCHRRQGTAPRVGARAAVYSGGV